MSSNTVQIETQPLTFIDFRRLQQKPESFTVSDGRFIGADGFVVPKDFHEFNLRYPQHVRLWVRKHGGASAQPQDLEDWTQDLLIHLKYLPATSKYRLLGKEDIVQTFDPIRHYGASQRRFLNYINLCLGNKFRTMRSARMKEPLCNPGNLSLSADSLGDCGQADEEFLHTHSAQLRTATKRLAKREQDRHLLKQFIEFVRREDFRTLPVIEAILATGTHDDAVAFLGLTEAGFNRKLTRLRQLAKCFVSGEIVPRQRKEYKKRMDAMSLARSAA